MFVIIIFFKILVDFLYRFVINDISMMIIVLDKKNDDVGLFNL